MACSSSKMSMPYVLNSGNIGHLWYDFHAIDVHATDVGDPKSLAERISKRLVSVWRPSIIGLLAWPDHVLYFSSLLSSCKRIWKDKCPFDNNQSSNCSADRTSSLRLRLIGAPPKKIINSFFVPRKYLLIGKILLSYLDPFDRASEFGWILIWKREYFRFFAFQQKW